MNATHILVKVNKTDATYSRILVRENDGYLEFYHTDLSKWVTLPEAWTKQAREALSVNERTPTA